MEGTLPIEFIKECCSTSDKVGKLECQHYQGHNAIDINSATIFCGNPDVCNKYRAWRKESLLLTYTLPRLPRDFVRNNCSCLNEDGYWACQYYDGTVQETNNEAVIRCKYEGSTCGIFAHYKAQPAQAAPDKTLTLPEEFFSKYCKPASPAPPCRCLKQHTEDNNQLVTVQCSLDFVVPLVCAKYQDVSSETDPGQKFDQGKPDYTLLEPELLHAYVRIREFGNKKYEPDSWKGVPDAYHRYLAAALRHLIAEIGDPRGIDDDSGMPHIWHAACNLGFLCYFLEHPQDESNN